MILHDGKEYYPLQFGRMVKDNKVYYDRSARQKSYVYLDLSLASNPDAVRVRDPTYLANNQ